MTAHHSIAIEIDDWGEPSLALVCDAPDDADCRSWAYGEEGAEPRPKEPDEGRECWAVEWVSAAGFEDAVTWVGSDLAARIASIPVDIAYSEGVAVILAKARRPSMRHVATPSADSQVSDGTDTQVAQQASRSIAAAAASGTWVSAAVTADTGRGRAKRICSSQMGGLPAMTWLNRPLLVLDMETDSLDPLDANPVQVCVGVSLRPGHWRSFAPTIKPSREIPAEATAVHGITTEYAEKYGIKREAAFDCAFEIVNKYAGTAPIVVHNAPYDLTILRRMHARFDTLIQGTPILDTLVLHRRFDRDTGSKSLTALAAKNGITFPAHDAEADSFATLRLLHILARKTELLPYVDLERLHDLQAGWYRQQQEQIVARKEGDGIAVPFETEWPMKAAT